MKFYCGNNYQLSKAMVEETQKRMPTTPIFSSCIRQQRILLQCRRSGFDPWVRDYPLEKEMETHSSVLAWRIPGTGEPSGLPSMESHGVGHVSHSQLPILFSLTL